MRRLRFRFLASTLVLLTVAFAASVRADDTPLPDGLYAEFATPRGNIVAELFFTKAPLTVASFVGLAEGTLGPAPRKPFFNGLTFHRVVPGFVIQGGDPLGTGEGGPGYTFPDEFAPGLRHDAAGILSMANAGPDTNGSQFFFTLAPVNRLNYLHSVFGHVVRGLDVLPRIQQGDVMATVTIRRLGAAAQAFRADEPTFAALVAQTPKATPPHFADVDGLLPPDPPRARAFDTKLANFERATGVKLYARLYEKFVPEKPRQTPGHAAAALARQLDLAPDATLAVHFADTGQWGLWIGDVHLAQFIGQPGTLAEYLKSGALHHAKQSVLVAAKTEADAAIAAAESSASSDHPVTAAQKTKLQIDAVLDALIFRLEPRP